MKLIFATICVLIYSCCPAQADEPLDTGFKNPPATAKARTWWHWLNGNVTREGITSDLEAMKEVGIQEAQIFNVSLDDPRGPAPYLSPQWLDLFLHAAEESKRLDIELGFHNGPGWSSSGGPWVTPEHAMQTVVFSQVTHSGGNPFKGKLPEPKVHLNHYRDIAVLAFPKPTSEERIDGLDYKILSDRVRNHLVPDATKIPASALIQQSDIIDLTANVSPEGMLEWEAPEGEWIILRLGHTPNGQRNRPAPIGGKGLECDKMSREAVDAFWEGGIAPIIEKLDTLAGSVLSNCVIDSYEVGTTNWTSGFDREFKRLRGYDCIRLLPTLAGYYVDSGEISERFLWDFRRTIGDLMAENYYGHFRTLCHEHGMKLSVEPYWGPFDNMQVGETGDIVMCEFWSGDIAFFDSPKFVASIAKLNGDSVVGAEAFTGLGGWTEHPATIKSIGDRAWAQGINRFIFHSYVHQPWEVGPGLTLSYHGLELNRLNTWWNQGAAFLDYVARSQFLLQQGESVADVLVFTGESSPNNARLMPEIKAMGYDYDLIGSNKIQSLTVENGLIRTTSGATYRALVLPQTRWMQPQTIEKLEELVAAGATIFGPRPEKSPSLQGYPACDQQVALLAEKLWNNGHIKDGSVVDFLNEGSVPPDFKIQDGPGEEISFIHRRSNRTDIYFVASQRKEKRSERCRFRVTGKQPEIWNAQTGEVKNAAQWQQHDDGTITVPIHLDPEGSLFIVFRKPVSASDHIVDTKVELEPQPIAPLPNLKIIEAQYGTFLPDGLIDVTPILTAKVKGNRLNAIASRKLFVTDPAPGYHKELRIQYQVGDSLHEIEVMEREEIQLVGGAEGELKIVKAIFGKFDETTKGVPANSMAHDVTQKIQSLVDSGVYEILVNQELAAGQSGQEQSGQLRIVYSSRCQLHKRLLSAGRTLNLGVDVPEPKLVSVDSAVNWLSPRAGQLVYRTSTGRTNTVRVDSVPESVELTGGWDVSFPADGKSPVNTTLNGLASWSTSDNQWIRFFSGTATYKKQFDLPKEIFQSDTSLELDLGSVHVIAEVVVNGNNLGTLWKAPFRVNLDGWVHEGQNSLEVKVTNLWPNRLIGDEHLPQDSQRKGAYIKQWPDWLVNQTERSSGRVGFAGYDHWDRSSELQTSGLLGPVVIRPYQRVDLFVDWTFLSDRPPSTDRNVHLTPVAPSKGH